jgi:hypothetical protein
MNTMSKSEHADASRGELAGKAAIITGSTSGIGLVPGIIDPRNEA